MLIKRNSPIFIRFFHKFKMTGNNIIDGNLNVKLEALIFTILLKYDHFFHQDLPGRVTTEVIPDNLRKDHQSLLPAKSPF